MIAWTDSNSAVAAATASIQIPTECGNPRTETQADSVFPFLDRVGDLRFAPLRLNMQSDATIEIQPKLSDLPVSAASLNNKTLLIVNYHNVSSLNIETGEVTQLTADLTRLRSTKFVPTGVAVGPRSSRIFIANYLGNNILVGRLTGDHLVFEKELAGEGVTSPENVAVAKDEAWLVSANYDGNSATGFKWEGGEYVQKWKTEIPLAHGVAILGDRVFVSSLQLKRIFTLDLSNGTVRGVFGEPGWRAYCLNFLWPTGLEAAGDNLLVVTDSHTGGVYRISFQDGVGALIDVVGGTAPGLAGLQMPYGTASIGGKLAILSTFSPKILIAGPAGAAATPKIEKVIVQHPAQAVFQGNGHPYRIPLGVGWDGYVHIGGPHLTVSGIDMVPSYASLVSMTEAHPARVDRVFTLSPDTLNLFGSYMYFIQAHLSRGAAILSSPSAPFVIYITLGEHSCAVKINLPGPPLAIDDGLEHRLGSVRYDALEQLGTSRLREIDLRRGANGTAELSDIAKALEISTEEAKTTIRSKAAAEALERCRPDKADLAECETAIAEYKHEAVSSGASFLELLLVDMSAHKCVL